MLNIRTARLASFTPVEPIARIGVTPEDFPFLGHIRGHDDARLADYAKIIQTEALLPD